MAEIVKRTEDDPLCTKIIEAIQKGTDDRFEQAQMLAVSIDDVRAARWRLAAIAEQIARESEEA